MPVKKNMKNRFFSVLLLVTTFFFSACVEDDTCGENMISGIKITVNNSGSDSATDLDALDQDKLSDWKVCPPNDTLAFVSMSTEYQFGIPLDIEDTTITLVFFIKDDGEDYLSDTLSFFYRQTDFKLVSMACGFAPEFEITGGKHSVNVLDSIVLETLEVSTDLTVNNVAIYY